MNNAELIATLRGDNYFVTLLHDAADALEAAEKRIEELEAQMPKRGVDEIPKRIMGYDTEKTDSVRKDVRGERKDGAE